MNNNNLNFDEFFKGKYFKASDLVDNPMVLTIKSIAKEEFPERIKPVFGFEAEKRAFVCNQTNLSILKAAWGKNMPSWCGKRVRLKADKTTFGGKLVDCIRVEPLKENAASAGAETDENVPF